MQSKNVILLTVHETWRVLLNISPKHVTNIKKSNIKLKNATSKLNNMVASVAFVKQALSDDAIRKFAVIKEQFINERDNLTASHKLMKSRITKNM